MQTLSIFDLATRADPYPVYRQLRETAPVYLEPEFGTYVLTRFEDVYNTLRDHETFSSAQGIAPGMRGGGMGGTTTIITSDPPTHTRLRGLVNKAFTPRVLAGLEPSLRGVVEELLDGLGTEDVEIVEGLTVPLPVIAIARLMGIPEGDRQKFKEWSDAVVGVTDRGIGGDMQNRMAEMFMYFTSTIAQRKVEPTSDLVGILANAEVEGERLTDMETVMFCILLLIAGNETTTNLLSNLLNVLKDRPDLWAQLRDDRSLVPAAIEEALRYDSPVQLLWRTATREVELHGVTIPAGGRVMVCYAAANRDPEEFPEPDEFRLDRDLSLHMAFGFGIHYCLGSPLARLEAKVAINGLLDRYESIGPGASGGERVPSSLLRGFRSLHLDLTPA